MIGLCCLVLGIVGGDVVYSQEAWSPDATRDPTSVHYRVPRATWIEQNKLWYWDPTDNVVDAIFPVGYYVNVDNDLYAAIDKLSDGGFNAIHIKPQYHLGAEITSEELGKIYDWADVNDVDVFAFNDMMTPDYRDVWQQRLRETARYPALVCNVYGDDVHGKTSAATWQGKNDIDQADAEGNWEFGGPFRGPIRATAKSMVNYKPDLDPIGRGDFPSYLRDYDGTILQTYPYYWRNVETNFWDIDWMTYYSDLQPNQWPLAAVQTFTWEVDSAPRFAGKGGWPSTKDVEVGSYLNLAAGAKGLLFYKFDVSEIPPMAYQADNFIDDDGDQPYQGIYQTTRRIARTVKAMERALLFGSRSAERSSDRFFQAHFDYGRQKYVIIVNARDVGLRLNDKKGTSVRVPAARSITPVGDSPVRNLSLKRDKNFPAGDRFSGWLPAKGVAVYRVDY